jgi:hypothetical protein
MMGGPLTPRMGTRGIEFTSARRLREWAPMTLCSAPVSRRKG